LAHWLLSSFFHDRQCRARKGRFCPVTNRTRATKVASQQQLDMKTRKTNTPPAAHRSRKVEPGLSPVDSTIPEMVQDYAIVVRDDIKEEEMESVMTSVIRYAKAYRTVLRGY